MCLLTTGKSFMKCLFKSFAPFFIEILAFWLLSFKSFLQVWCTIPWPDAHTVIIFLFIFSYTNSRSCFAHFPKLLSSRSLVTFSLLNFQFLYYSTLGQYSTWVIPGVSGHYLVLVSSCLAGPSTQSPLLLPLLPTLPRLVHFWAQPLVPFSFLFLFTPLVILSQIIISTQTSPRTPDSHTTLTARCLINIQTQYFQISPPYLLLPHKPTSSIAFPVSPNSYSILPAARA